MNQNAIKVVFLGFLVLILNLISLQEVVSQTFNKEVYEFSLSEEANIGAEVGQLTLLNDEEKQFTFSIKHGNTNKAFKIDPNTGLIVTEKRLNHHFQTNYSLSVTASDPEGIVDEATVVIHVYKEAEVPEFSTLTWGTASDHPYGLHEIQGKTVGGKVYVFGGFDAVKQPSNWTPTKRAYFYEPTANKFSSIADLPYTPNGESYGGVSHAGIATDGNDIFFAGGYTSNNAGTGQIFGTKQVWKYHVGSNSYSSLPDLPVAISTGQMEYLEGKLHYISGTNVARNQDLDSHYVLDLDNLEAGWKSLAPLPNPRQHAGSTVFEGKIYFIGGQKGHDDNLIAQKDVHAYDPIKDQWTKMADLPVPSGKTGRGHITSSVVVYGDRIIVLGGETAHGEKTNLVSAYTPSKNSWEALTPLPENIMAGVASVLGENIYYLGGNFKKTNRKATPVFPTHPTPEVQITKPVNNESFKEGIDIAIEAEANISGGSIAKVEFFSGNEKLGEDATSPYTFSWKNADAGTYTLSAKAISDKGVSSTSSNVAITIVANLPPDVQIVTPENGSGFTEGSSIEVRAEANDPDGSVAKVVFFEGDNSIGEVSEHPFKIEWPNVSPGNYVLKAIAYDNENKSTTSSVVQITISKPGNINPSVSIIYPEEGTVFLEGAAVEILVEASDEDGTIQKVEAYNGVVKLGEVITVPYTITWNNIPAGTHEISVKAYDNDGGTKESASVSIEVSSIATCAGTGGLLMEYWSDVSGTELSSSLFSGPPTGTSEIESFEAPANFSQNYATKISGYICPPADGEYLFGISSSHLSELWISSTDDPETKIKIAHSVGNPEGTWDHYGSQESAPVSLKIGEIYYIEAVHLINEGADHLAVGWKWPDGRTERPIQGSRLIPFSSTITHVDNKDIQPFFTIFPVPSKDNVQIEYVPIINENIQMDLLNSQGKSIQALYTGEVLPKNLLKIVLDTRQFSKGIYFVRIFNRKTYLVKKIILNP